MATWTDNKYKLTLVTLEVDLEVWHRIAPHRDKLISKIKKEIKKIGITTVVKVRKVRDIYHEEKGYE